MCFGFFLQLHIRMAYTGLFPTSSGRYVVMWSGYEAKDIYSETLSP